MKCNYVEEWRPVKGFEGSYFVSNLGRVKSVDRKITQGNRWGQRMERKMKGRVLSPKLDKYGYHVVLLYNSDSNGDRTYITVHRLVALTFLSNPDNKPQVDHKDHDKLNNNLSNLRWVSAKVNSENAKEKGVLDNRDGSQKLNMKKAIEIRKIYAEGSASQSKLAEKYGVSKRAIQHILNYRNYK